MDEIVRICLLKLALTAISSFANTDEPVTFLLYELECKFLYRIQKQFCIISCSLSWDFKSFSSIVKLFGRLHREYNIDNTFDKAKKANS